MKSPLLKQTWVVSAILINMLEQGMMISYPTSLVPAILDPNSSIKTDLSTAAWLGSSTALSYAVGALLSSALMALLGRKTTHIISTLPGLIGWLLIYYATDITTIMCGRVLTGLTSGATISIAAVVIGEYTTPKYRGVFLNLKNAGNCIGNMFVHILSYYLSWRDIALVGAVPYVIALLITFTWPESPAWLASKQQFERSQQAFYWLRGRQEDSTKEINEMITIQMNIPKCDENLHNRHRGLVFFKKFTDKSFLMPVFVASVGMLLLEACGRHVFPAYALQIIGEITNNTSESFYYTIIIDIIITTSAVSSSVLVKVMKRRTLLFSMGFAAVSVLATVCVYLYLVSLNIISKESSWIPVSLLMLFFILANLGSTPIPLALLGELYPLEHRGVGTTIGGLTTSLAAFLTIQMTPHILIKFKVHGMFAIFVVMMAICLTIMYFTLPETKDKTLQEIEYFFRYGKYPKEAAEYDEARTEMIKSNV